MRLFHIRNAAYDDICDVFGYLSKTVPVPSYLTLLEF